MSNPRLGCAEQPLNLAVKPVIKMEAEEFIAIQSRSCKPLILFENVYTMPAVSLNLGIKDDNMNYNVRPVNLSKKHERETTVIKNEPVLDYSSEMTITRDTTEDTKSGNLKTSSQESNILEIEFVTDKTIEKVSLQTEEVENTIDGKVLANQNDKNELINTTEKPKMLTCDCGYQTTETRLYRRHVKSHLKTIYHPCFYCVEKYFCEKRDLDWHILRIHSKNKEACATITSRILRCKYCDFKTTRSNNIDRHMITHKNIHNFDQKRFKKYECLNCMYATCSKGSIIKHVRLHKTLNHLPFQCDSCQKKFNEKKSLDSHILKNHPESDLVNNLTNKVWFCELCDYKDVNKSKITRHQSAKHVKEIDMEVLTYMKEEE